jgi:hypothetical protein
VSKTQFVDFRGAGIWAIDVICSVFLKYLIDAGAERVDSGADKWLADTLEKWRLNAIISEFGLYLDNNWSPSQIDTITDMCRQVSDELLKLGSIPASELEECRILDELGISAGNVDPIPCEPVVRFVGAVMALLNNTLPPAPDGYWWLYTLEEKPQTVPKIVSR